VNKSANGSPIPRLQAWSKNFNIILIHLLTTLGTMMRSAMKDILFDQAM
jgi:hypothetical protein